MFKTKKRGYENSVLVLNRDGVTVAEVFTDVEPGDQYVTANLLAAAPELLDSLRHALEALGLANREYRRLVRLHDPNADDAYSGQFHNAIARSMQAIAKATGEEA